MLAKIKLAVKWWKTWRTWPVGAWLNAAALYRAGRFAEAESLYEEGLRKYPSHPARYCAQMDLAYCLFKRRKHEEAEEQLKKVVSEMPQSREAILRLAKVQMWSGNYLGAAWTIRDGLHGGVKVDPELVALFLISVVENGGPTYLINDAVSSMIELSGDQMSHPKLEVARALLAAYRGDHEHARAVLAGIAGQQNAPFEAYLFFAEALLQEKRVAHARRELRRAMAINPDHPRVLSLFAETYLQEGPFFNPEFAKQLATTATQHTNWLSPREMHTLAQAYYHGGDKMSALIIASKARDVGTERFGTYRDSKTLEAFIQTLSAGTQA